MASVASKMSVIIPISLGVILYNENLGFIKIIGILLALVAVILLQKETGVYNKLPTCSSYFSIFGAGTIDASLKYPNFSCSVRKSGLFSSVTFFCAFSGNTNDSISNFQEKIQFVGRNILGGIVLVYPIIFIVFLVKMLEAKHLKVLLYLRFTILLS